MSCQLLHRIDSDLNMARFYRVELTPDLFGQVIVERRWGRIGSRGQFRSASYESTSAAEAAAFALISAKEGRGYRLIDHHGHVPWPRHGVLGDEAVVRGPCEPVAKLA